MYRVLLTPVALLVRSRDVSGLTISLSLRQPVCCVHGGAAAFCATQLGAAHAAPTAKLPKWRDMMP